MCLSVLSCYRRANGTGHVEKMGVNNLVFAASFELRDMCTCVDLLIKMGWAPEAALFARAYAPR